MGAATNNGETTTESLLYNGQQLKPLGVEGGWGGVNALTVQLFARDAADVKAQENVEVAWKPYKLMQFTIIGKQSNQMTIL